MTKKAINLFIFLVFFVSLSACNATPAVAPETLPTVTMGDPNWITIQIISFEVLEASSDLDKIDEFKLILIAGDERKENAAQFLYPPNYNISVQVGKEIPGSNCAISANAHALGEKVYVYFAGFDVDEVDNVGNFFLDLSKSVVSTFVGYGVTGGVPIPVLSDGISIITDLALGAVSDSLQEDDVIGEGTFVLEASDNWGVGEPHTITSANNGLKLTYQVTASEFGPGETVVTSSLPEGYLLYDSFSQATLENRWWLDDPNQICVTNIDSGQFVYQCTNNDTKDDILATLHPNGMPSRADGIYTVMTVSQSGGIAKPATNWICDGDPTAERAYHFELGYDYAEAVEFYPNDSQQPWRSVSLAKVPVTSNVSHSLQIEHKNNTIQFYLDGNLLPLGTEPNLPSCAVMRDWGFDFLAWKDGNTVAGQIDLIGIHYP